EDRRVQQAVRVRPHELLGRSRPVDDRERCSVGNDQRDELRRLHRPERAQLPLRRPVRLGRPRTPLPVVVMAVPVRSALLLFALGSLVALAPAAAPGGVRAMISPTLNIAVDNTDVDHSDPGLAYSVLMWQMEQETCDTLVGYSDHSGSVSTG